MIIENIVKNIDNFMGVKAVWGTSEEAVMCFSNKGTAHGVAERSLLQPFFMTIGGGSGVPSSLKGRVLELVKPTTIYGDTKAFVQNSLLKEKLMQWPFSIVIYDTYDILGYPRIIEDLGLPNRKILSNAFDNVRRNDELIPELWTAIRGLPVRRRTEIIPPPGFYCDKKVRYCSTLYPRLDTSSREGRRIYKESVHIERNKNLKKLVKEINKNRNKGALICEGCDFSDKIDSMFDVHHLTPISCEERENFPDDLVVLCPTCHRWVHQKGEDQLSPLPISLLRIDRFHKL